MRWCVDVHVCACMHYTHLEGKIIIMQCVLGVHKYLHTSTAMLQGQFLGTKPKTNNKTNKQQNRKQKTKKTKPKKKSGMTVMKEGGAREREESRCGVRCECFMHCSMKMQYVFQCSRVSYVCMRCVVGVRVVCVSGPERCAHTDRSRACRSH